MKNHHLIMLAVGFANLTAFSLIVVKTIAYFTTGSLVILASLADSSLDFLMSLVNTFSIRYAFKPADTDHRFGHAAIEDITSLFQAAIMSCSALYVVQQAVVNFLHGNLQHFNNTGIYIMLFSLVMTLILVGFLLWAANKTNSLALKTESLHYTSDILTNGAILVSLLVIKYWQIYIIDQILAVIISGYLLWCALNVFQQAFNNLMGKELPEEITQQILNITKQEPQISGCNSLRTRNIGSRKLIHLEISFPAHMSILETHNITENLENKIRQQIENADVIIHQEPVGK